MKIHILLSFILALDGLLVKRVVLTLFTGLAIAWSSGYKFGGNEKSGI